MSGKKRDYHQQAIKRHYGGELRGLSHEQLVRQRGLRGIKLGPANRGRRLDAAERQAIEQKMRNDGRPPRADLSRASEPSSMWVQHRGFTLSTCCCTGQ
jgi:hypothetical protein